MQAMLRPAALLAFLVSLASSDSVRSRLWPPGCREWHSQRSLCRYPRCPVLSIWQRPLPARHAACPCIAHRRSVSPAQRYACAALRTLSLPARDLAHDGHLILASLSLTPSPSFLY